MTETRRLVQEDQVFAMFASVGTANNLAVRPLLNALKVPQLFVGDGSVGALGRPEAIPVDDRLPPELRRRGRDVRPQHQANAAEGARSPCSAEDSPLGNDLLAGLRRGLGRSGAKVVAVQKHEPAAVDVASQIASLRASRADTLMLFTTPLFFIRGAIAVNKLGWKPQLFINSISIEPSVMRTAAASAPQTVRDAISMVWLKDPTNPRWASDRGVRLYRQLMARYCRRAAASATSTTTRAWRSRSRWSTRCGGPAATSRGPRCSAPRRTCARRTTRSCSRASRVQTTPTSHFPISKAQLYRYRGGRWQPFSGLLGAKG